MENKFSREGGASNDHNNTLLQKGVSLFGVLCDTTQLLLLFESLVDCLVKFRRLAEVFVEFGNVLSVQMKLTFTNIAAMLSF